MASRVQIFARQARSTLPDQAAAYLARQGDIWPHLFRMNLLMKFPRSEPQANPLPISRTTPYCVCELVYWFSV